MAPAPRGAAAPPGPPADGIARVQRDRRGRGGKTATTVSGLPGDEQALDALLKQLKVKLGTGGVREGGVLVIQGDQRERLMAELAALGLKAKLAGG
ncbi:MAG: translation initiation factor [Dehalococcoidia bacterium]